MLNFWRAPLLGLALAMPLSAEAATKGAVGLGVVLGDPTALSMAFRPNDDWYIQGALGWNLTTDRVALNVDYCMTLATLQAEGSSGVTFPFYVGIGGRLRIDDDDWDDWDDDDWDDDDSSLGIRVPVGLGLMPPKAPLEFFVELAPVVELIPGTDLDFDAGIGGRFYF